MIKVAVCGANGRMGKQIVKMVKENPDMTLEVAVDVEDASFYTLEVALQSFEIDVVVDFTNSTAVYNNAITCLNNGVNLVIGTTGLPENKIENIKNLAESKNVGCLIAPNFSIGAILMMEFAQKAAKYFGNAEIIEYHHNQKKDAPSGTAIKTAKMMSEAKASFVNGNSSETEVIAGSRGGIADSDIHIHSVRMPGYMASQEVLFGSDGQTLSIRHDSYDRSCYMSGVNKAIRYVMEHNEFVWGLEHIL